MERFVLNRRDAKFMGVAAGIADRTGVDPLFVRLGLIAAIMLTGPVAAVLYVATGLLAPAA